MYWITKRGEMILISEMEDSHLINAYKTLIKNKFITEKRYNNTLQERLRDLSINEENFNSIMKKPFSAKMQKLKYELKKRNLLHLTKTARNRYGT